MNRYFIVSYLGYKDADKIHVTGMVNFTVENGRYLNRNKCLRYLEKQGVSHVTITFITELSESDYKDWIDEQ